MIHPYDQNQVYFGGARARTTVDGVTAWQAALYRADIGIVGGAPVMTHVNIGRAVSPYVNAISFSPHREAELWVGTDSGIFYSDKPGSVAPLIFEQRNASLGNHAVRSLAQHPREETVLLGGTDGNGSLRYVGSEAWSAAYNADDQYSHASNVHLGDAGYTAINWNDPYRILIMAAPSSATLTAAAPPGRPKALIIQASNGGADPDPPAHREEVVTLDAGDSVQHYSPLAANPHVTGNAAEADRAAFGTRQLWVSDSFGNAGSWQKAGAILPNHIRCITFASFTRIYVGTIQGEVYRFDYGGGHWIFGGDPTVLQLIHSLAPTRSYARKSSVIFPDRNLRVPYPLQNHLHALDPQTYPRTATTAYAMDYKELELILDNAKRNGAKLKAFYHSHPNHDAYFSAEDKAFASPFGEPTFPGAGQIVVSVYDHAIKGMRAFIWSDEQHDFIEVSVKFT